MINLSAYCTTLVAADHDPAMVRSAFREQDALNVRGVAADAYRLPFSNASFDHLIALGLFAYITDAGRALHELRRVLAKRGTVLLTNSVAHPKEPLVAAAKDEGFDLAEEDESPCLAASGPVKMRYLLVLVAGGVRSN